MMLVTVLMDQIVNSILGKYLNKIKRLQQTVRFWFLHYLVVKKHWRDSLVFVSYCIGLYVEIKALLLVLVILY